MLRFPIEWHLLCTDFYYLRSNLNLNDEWSLSCVLKSLPDIDKYKFDFIEIRRKTISELTSISGTISLRGIIYKESTQAFSKLIESGSAFTKLIDLHSDIILSRRYVNDDPFLHGVVNIISVSKKCSSDFENRGVKIYYQPKSLVQLSDDLERLLDPQTSCNADVNLKCGSASIPAHKLILSARSPVFAAMFKNPMKETHKNEVEITDIDASVLQAMITYIYTGKTSGLTVSSASDLLFAAEKYQLQDLKRVCCDFLKESVSLQNVMKIFVLGDLYAEDLKSFGMDYICTNYNTFSEFENIEEWATLRKERPALAVDILVFLLKSKDQKKKG